MSQQQRFTAWLSEEERTAIELAAKEYGTTMNYIVRVAVRSFLRLPVSPTHQAPQGVTPVTRNK